MMQDKRMIKKKILFTDNYCTFFLINLKEIFICPYVIQKLHVHLHFHHLIEMSLWKKKLKNVLRCCPKERLFFILPILYGE
jgi:hypothetical protein